MGRTTNELLEKHGARRVCPYGEGDDDATLEEDFDKWRDAIWPVMIAAFHPDGAEEDAADVLPGEGGISESRKRVRTSSKVEIEFAARPVLEEEVADLKRSREYDVGHADSKKSSAGEGKLFINSSTKFYFTAEDCPVIVNKELREPADGGVTRHIEVDISKSGMALAHYDIL